MKRSTPPRAGHSNLPVPKVSKGTPGNSKSLSRGNGFAHSAEDIPKRVQYSPGPGSASPSPTRRALSPGNDHRGRMTLPPGEQGGQVGVRYITEDLIKKIAKEDNLEMITNLNMTLSKEGGKKFKYIENFDKLKRLQTLNLSCNIIEKLEKLDKLQKLMELNVSYNNISKIEGLENLANLQVLNLTGNNIQQIPVWMAKRLKSLRVLHLGKNNMQSMSELSKLKPLPDLTELTVAENPLCQIPHYRLYLIFHLRTLQVLDSQPVTEQERRNARDRFEQDEVERLEKQLEAEEAKNRKYEEEHNRSAHESSLSKAAEGELRKKEQNYRETIEELERELNAKDDILKKKTAELNKACEKHYQLEQELAFHKLDSKFDSLGHSPGQFSHEGDDSTLDESPYIGRARYKANQYAREGTVGAASPHQPQVVSVKALPVNSPQRAEIMEKLNSQLDHELAEKQDRVQKTEDRLKRLQEDMLGTERKLQQATKDLKRMGDITEKEDVRAQLRQRLAKKMQLVNDLKDSATQIEEEIDKTQDEMRQQRIEVARLKGQLEHLDPKDPKYKRIYSEMVDKEQQINESNQLYGQLQQQLEVMLDTIAKETNEIKKLEQQINTDHIDANESLRTELDEIVGGLQSYLSNVRQQGKKRQRDFDSVLSEKSQLEQRVAALEQELSILDQEADNYKKMEKRLQEMEESMNMQQNMNKTLEDQLHRTRRQDADYQEKLENTSAELMEVKRALKEAERKSQYEKQSLDAQLQTERDRAQKAYQQARSLGNIESEKDKIQRQLEAVKAQNNSYKEQLENERQTRMKETIPLNELRKRLRDLTHSVKSGKEAVEPVDDKDYLGKSFKDVQNFMKETLNKSFRETDEAKKKTDKADDEIRHLRDELKKAENKLAKKDSKEKDKENRLQIEKKAKEDENRRLNEENEKLRGKIRELMNRISQGRPFTQIVHRPGSESDRSSMNSEEKALYDELQKELLELRRTMRNKEEENARTMADLETEAAIMEQALQDQEKKFQEELTNTRKEAELLREKHEARMQVIAQDLDQAQEVADQLQQQLDDRDHQLNEVVQGNEMSNHMLTAQEDELARLYEILDAQKDEIEHLNGMLDQLLAQAPGGANPAFDDELWRLRQEVNRLKETLAMQSAYVQTMPQAMTSAGIQVDHGVGTGAPGMAVGVSTGGPVPKLALSQHHNAPVSVMPPLSSSRLNKGASAYGPGGVSHPASGRGHGSSRSPGRGLANTAAAAAPHGPGDETDRMSRGSRGSRGSRSRGRTLGSRSAPSQGVQRPQAFRPSTASGPGVTFGPSSGVQTGPMGAPVHGGGAIPAGMPFGGPQYTSTGTGGYVHGGQVAGGPQATQTPGYAWAQTPGHMATQTPGHVGSQTRSGGPTVGVAPIGNIGSQGYTPAGTVPGHATGSGRMFIPAYSTSIDKPAGRIYYPPGTGGRGYGSGGAPPPPPPPPPPGHQIPMPGSPGPRVTFLPVTPVAAGTPQKNRAHVNSSMSYPPSPILAGSNMDAGPRGILKSAGVDDDSYLFCNVPEHHDLEDYIAELQDKLRRLKARLAESEEAESESDQRLIKRLRNELEERRGELEGLDLAIERQKRNLKNLRKEERKYEVERAEAKEELQFLRKHNAKQGRKRSIWKKALELDSDDSVDREMLSSRQRYLQDEVENLERTLSKRRDQLRDADRLLKKCNTDLQDARDQARHTIDKYDNAATNLEFTVKETNELERRANQAGVELVKAAEQLSSLRAEVASMEKKKGKQERLLRDVNQVINKRDMEFKDLDSKVRMATQNLQRVQADLSAASQREKETLNTLRDAEDVLGKRRSEIARMREQHKEMTEIQRQELEKVDQQIGKKRTELNIIQQTAEQKQTELSQVLRDADIEVSSKQQEIKELRELCQDLETQKVDLLSLLKAKRHELSKLKEDIQTEEEVLQKLIGTVNKHKSELKHVYEMQKIEQTELNNVKNQHAQKVAMLEKTQRQLIEEKSELDQLTSEINRKSGEMERLRQTLDRDRQDCERVSMEKRSFEDRITAMEREKDLLEDNCKSLDNKINQMKRTHGMLEEKLDTTKKRLESVEIELQQREKEIGEANHQKMALQKDIQMLKSAVKENKSDLKSIKDHMREVEDKVRHLEEDLRDTTLQRDDAKMEIERINEAIRTSRMTYEDYMRQERQKHEELQELLKSVATKEFEYQEARMALNKVKKDVEREENKLNKLVSNANMDLEHVREEIESKQMELEQATAAVDSLKRESDQLEANQEKIYELENRIKELERELIERNEEKAELSKALSRSYEELQKLRTEAAQDHEKTTMEKLQTENALHDMQTQLELAKQEMKHMQKRTVSQVSELQNIAEVHFNKANRLDTELNRIRKENKEMRRQLRGLTEVLETEKPYFLGYDSANAERLELIDSNKENIIYSSAPIDDNRHEDLRGKLAEEQDLLRLQLQQQMQRHADAMESARLQSEGTIENLRKKLNTLQEVLINTNGSSEPAPMRSRTRSSSPPTNDTNRERQRSPSPSSKKSYQAQRPRSRSQSSDIAK